MKGLLVKDFRLLMNQKRFFLALAFVTVLMAMTNDSPVFMAGFLVYMMSQFALSTISYDEFDHGYAYLFTLPVSRGAYAASKYVFGFLLTLGSGLAALLLALPATQALGRGQMTDVVFGLLGVVPAVLLVQAVMIPMMLKYGGEKGRLVLIGVVGALCALFFLGSKAPQAMNVDLEALMQSASRWSLGLGLTAVCVLTLAAMALSLRISVGIMEKKEF